MLERQKDSNITLKDHNGRMVLDMSELHTVKEKCHSLRLRAHFRDQTDLDLNPDLMKNYQLCDIVKVSEPQFPYSAGVIVLISSGFL